MITTFKLKITGTPDIYVPFSTISYRQKSGTKSYFNASLPDLSYMDAINDRQDGDIIVERYKNGVYFEDFLTTNFDNLIPNYGANKQSAVLYGKKQITYTQNPERVELQHIFYRAPNRTNGKYTYHGCQIIDDLHAGDNVSYDGHDFTLEEIQYNISDRINIYYKES